MEYLRSQMIFFVLVTLLVCQVMSRNEVALYPWIDLNEKDEGVIKDFHTAHDHYTASNILTNDVIGSKKLIQARKSQIFSVIKGVGVQIKYKYTGNATIGAVVCVVSVAYDSYGEPYTWDGECKQK